MTNAPETRKTHVIRILGTNKNGDVLRDIWADVERMDEETSVTQGEVSSYQGVVTRLRWMDDPDDDDFDPDGNPSRKMRIVKVCSPDEPDQSDPEEWIPIPVIEKMRLVSGDQGIVHNFVNDAATSARIVEARRILHYDTNIDDKAQAAFDADPTRKVFVVSGDQYTRKEDTKVAGQYLEHEIITHTKSRASGVTKTGQGDDQGRQTKLLNQYLIDESEPAKLEAVGDNGFNPPWRLDPYQNIVNVQWGGAVQVPVGVWWRMPNLPELSEFSLICAIFVEENDFNMGAQLTLLSWGKAQSKDGQTDGLTTSVAAGSTYNMIDTVGDGVTFAVWDEVKHGAHGYSCGFFVKCATQGNFDSGQVGIGSAFLDGSNPPGTSCILFDGNILGGYPNPFPGWNGETFSIEGPYAKHSGNALHGDGLFQATTRPGRWHVHMISVRANGDVTTAIDDTDFTQDSYTDNDGNPIKPYHIEGNTFDFTGGARCDGSPATPLEFGTMQVITGENAIMGQAFFTDFPTGGSGDAETLGKVVTPFDAAPMAIAGYQLFDKFINWSDAGNRRKVIDAVGGDLIYRGPKAVADAFGEPLLWLDGSKSRFVVNRGSLVEEFKIEPQGGDLKSFSPYPSKLNVSVKSHV